MSSIVTLRRTLFMISHYANPSLRIPQKWLISPHLPFPFLLQPTHFAARGIHIAPQAHTSSAPVNLVSAFERVKKDTAMRRHPGLLISSDDAIAAGAEEKNFKELKQVFESIKQLLDWRKSFLAACNYELDIMATELKININGKIGKATKAVTDSTQPIGKQLFTMQKEQAQVAEILQNCLTRFASLKAKVESKPEVAAVELTLAKNPPKFPLEHEWDNRVLTVGARITFNSYIATELTPLRQELHDDVVKLQCKLKAFEKAMS